VALDGGAEGLDYHPHIIAGARDYLRDGGVIFLEIGSEQAEAVTGMFARAGGYLLASVHRDYAGRARVVVAKRGGAHG
jgi:release factor glutamine methyltransferase